MIAEPLLALLIDADNATAQYAKRLFDEIKEIGHANVRRIYGDFSDSHLKPWKDLFGNYALTPQQTVFQCLKKNASDIALVIDAMDLLHSGRFNKFCLVSSDSDFTRLAMRLREHGLEVYGFGESGKMSQSFRKACTRYTLLDKPRPLKQPKKQPATAPPPA